MSQITSYKVYKQLLENKAISKSKIAKSLLNSQQFSNLLNANILISEKVGRGQHIKVNKTDEFTEFFRNTFPNDFDPNLEVSRAENIRTFRNSKAKARASSNICLFRGNSTATINGFDVDIGQLCKKFTLFSTQLESLSCKNLCFVENLEPFLHLTVQFGESVLYLHTYGRVSQSVLQAIEAEVVWVFVDYDYNGLDEYLRIQNYLPQAQLFIPEDYQTLFENYAVPYTQDKKPVMSQKLKECQEPKIIAILEQVANSNAFLEQEVVFYDEVVKLKEVVV